MYNMYFTITSVCNQNCLCCPYTEQDERFPEVKREEIISAVKKAFSEKSGDEPIDVILSGGEPTLHSEFALLVGDLQRLGVQVHLLSNGERFCEEDFLCSMDTNVDWSRLFVTTTLHGHTADIHEVANRKPGSLARTLKGLHALDERMAHVIVKHCITGTNYGELCEFYRFIDEEFGKHVPLYLCGIDYIGIPQDRMEKERIGLPEIRPALEELFDLVEKDPDHRRVYGTHIPLCWADPYYWKYLRLNHPDFAYQASGRYGEIKWNASLDSGIHKKSCEACIVKHLCQGTYFSAFDALGPGAFKAYLK